MGSDDVLSLRDYLTVLRRQAWLIALTTVLVVAAAVAVSLLQTPIYESRAEVVVEPVRRTQDVSIEQLLSPGATVVETERVIITSRPVTERAIERLGGGDPVELVEQVSVEVVRDTRVVEIVAEDPDPVTAASIANAFAAGYLDFRRDQAVDELLAARENLEDRANGLREQIAALEQQTTGDAEEDAALDIQRESLLAQLSQVVAQQAEVGDTMDSVSGGGAIIEPASVSTTPVSPQTARTGLLALVLGLLLGVGFAFLRDHFDDVVRVEVDVRRATGDRPILGRIPRWSSATGEDRLATIVEPASLAAEAYRELSAGVRFLLVSRRSAQPDGDDTDASAPEPGRSIMVVSANASEGKSSTAANLAVAAARVGLQTVLVDADLRRAVIHKRFGFARSTGLCDALLGDGGIEDHVLDVGIDNLVVLPAGTVPPNPTELLASPAMRAVQQQLLEQADLVIFDTPAVLAVPDPLELGRFVDLAILVGRAGATSRRQLSAAVERLEQVGTDIAGTVLNDIDTRSDAFYYSYYYRSDEPKEPRRNVLLRRGRDRAGDAETGESEQGAAVPDTGRSPDDASAPTAAGDGELTADPLVRRVRRLQPADDPAAETAGAQVSTAEETPPQQEGGAEDGGHSEELFSRRSRSRRA